MAGSYLPDSAVTSSKNPTNQGMTKKADAKTANEASKKVEIKKKSVYVVPAAGTFEVAAADPFVISADYYRDGKLNLNAGDNDPKYERMPRELVPISNLKNVANPASIRLWGRVKSPKTDKKSDSKTVYGDLIPAYTKFILESVQESRTERSQIIETFGDFYVFMFGERPSIFNFTGTLINSVYVNWLNDFDFMYSAYLRGTKCVEANATVLITYGGRQVNGLMLNMTTQTNAAIESGVPVQFSVVVFDRRAFLFSEDLGYFINEEGNIAVDDKLRTFIDTIAGEEGKNTARPDVSEANKEAEKTMSGKGPASGTVKK